MMVGRYDCQWGALVYYRESLFSGEKTEREKDAMMAERMGEDGKEIFVKSELARRIACDGMAGMAQFYQEESVEKVLWKGERRGRVERCGDLVLGMI